MSTLAREHPPFRFRCACVLRERDSAVQLDTDACNPRGSRGRSKDPLQKRPHMDNLSMFEHRSGPIGSSGVAPSRQANTDRNSRPRVGFDFLYRSSRSTGSGRSSMSAWCEPAEPLFWKAFLRKDTAGGARTPVRNGGPKSPVWLSERAFGHPNRVLTAYMRGEVQENE